MTFHCHLLYSRLFQYLFKSIFYILSYPILYPIRFYSILILFYPIIFYLILCMCSSTSYDRRRRIETWTSGAFCHLGACHPKVMRRSVSWGRGVSSSIFCWGEPWKILHLLAIHHETNCSPQRIIGIQTNEFEDICLNMVILPLGYTRDLIISSWVCLKMGDTSIVIHFQKGQFVFLISLGVYYVWRNRMLGHRLHSQIVGIFSGLRLDGYSPKRRGVEDSFHRTRKPSWHRTCAYNS